MQLLTPRLLLRPPRLADAPLLFAFLANPAAMRYSLPHESLRDCRRRLAAHERRRRRDGCAPWTILRREDARVVGYGGLYLDPFDPRWGIELGYWFDPDAWGRGYASELALACAGYADGALGLAETFGFAHPANLASRRVLEKAGFRPLAFVAELDRLMFRRPRSIAA